MKLVRYKIEKFRSIDKTEWIDVDDVTALIGTNESGKTNALLPLWKLSPATGGAIDLVADLPRSLYKDYRSAIKKPIFIIAEYLLTNDERTHLAEITSRAPEEFAHVIVSKDYDNHYFFCYPDSNQYELTGEEFAELVRNSLAQLEAQQDKVYAELQRKNEALSLLNEILTGIKGDEVVTADILKATAGRISSVIQTRIKTSSVHGILDTLLQQINDCCSKLSTAPLDQDDNLNNEVAKYMPKYVYYSNYGNLDSRIYLPQVINDLSRKDLTEKEAAKVRTIKTLFDFVGLDPKEILKLGELTSNPSAVDIEKSARDRDERLILLESAATDFSRQFNEWWQQGDYKFEFRADGPFFKIWVSDSKRPESIELEARSTGLQWFFSFYLVFLIESAKSHKNAILLLDEPGITLHPLAQRDLFKFFDNLAINNQIIYTTHSPFMIDSNHLERVRSVYIDNSGYSEVSSDLRASEKLKGKNQIQSVYPAHAALGLSVSEALLNNCLPVLVEGETDQYYLTGLKIFLISINKFVPKREIIFIPFGGTRSKGLQGTISILAGVTEGFPCVVLDSDANGQRAADELLQTFYKNANTKVFNLLKYFPDRENCEIEDIFPKKRMAKIINRILSRQEDLDDEFFDVYDETLPLGDQVDTYIKTNHINLDCPWKIKLARIVKKELGKPENKILSAEDEEVAALVTLFNDIQDTFVGN